MAGTRPFLLGHVCSGIPILQALCKLGEVAVLSLKGGRYKVSPETLGRLCTAWHTWNG